MYKSNCVIEKKNQKQGGPPMQDQSSLKISDSFQFFLESLSRGASEFFGFHKGEGLGATLRVVELSETGC